MDFLLENGPDAHAELRDLLDFNGFEYKEVGEDFCLVFADRGCKWTTVCRAQGSAAVILSRFPFEVSVEAGLRFCSEVNAKLLYGSVFLQGNTIICRNTADLFDGYMAYEAIGRALEYNAGAMTALWERAAALAAPDQSERM